MEKDQAEYLAASLKSKLVIDPRIIKASIQGVCDGMDVATLDLGRQWGIRLTYAGKKNYGWENVLFSAAQTAAEKLRQEYVAVPDVLPWEKPALSFSEIEFSQKEASPRFPAPSLQLPKK